MTADDAQTATPPPDGTPRPDPDLPPPAEPSTHAPDVDPADEPARQTAATIRSVSRLEESN